MSAERRFFRGAIEVRDLKGGAGTLVGHGAVYFDAADPGTEYAPIDEVRERVLPGAFDAALKDGDVFSLFNHDENQILGRSKSGTLRLSSDARGLRYEVDVPDTQAGRDVVTLAKRGDVTDSSFGFRAVDQKWRKDGNVLIRELRAVELFDVGPVWRGAYPAADVSARSEIRSAMETARAEIEAKAREAGSLMAQDEREFLDFLARK